MTNKAYKSKNASSQTDSRIKLVNARLRLRMQNLLKNIRSQKSNLFSTKNKLNVISLSLKKERNALILKQAELAALHQKVLSSKKHLEATFDAITDGICVLDRNFNIVRVNRGYARMVNADIKSLLSSRCHIQLTGKNEKCPNCPVARTMKTKKFYESYEIEINKNGKIFYYSINSFPIIQNGEVIYVIEYIRDISERKQIDAQLFRTAKLASIGTMVAGIAHEMNNPLSGISGNASNMLSMPEKYGLNQKGQERLKVMLSSAAKATVIMKDLLDLSRFKSNTRTKTDLNALIARTVESLHLKGFKTMDKSIGLDAQLPLVECDPSKIEQVLINLLTNAFQAMEEKTFREKNHIKKLVIQTNRSINHAIIQITDNGIGIKKELVPLIFDPFFTTKGPGQGTGLGLSICHKIISEHDGEIAAACANGLTTFTVKLLIRNNTERNS